MNFFLLLSWGPSNNQGLIQIGLGHDKRPPEFSKISWRPPWFFSAASHLFLWSEKSPPENTKAMKSAPLNLLMHFLSPPENEKAKLMPPWILRWKTERRIHPKTATFNRLIQGGLAHQKCYARVQPGHSVARQTVWLNASKQRWSICQTPYTLCLGWTLA